MTRTAKITKTVYNTFTVKVSVPGMVRDYAQDKTFNSQAEAESYQSTLVSDPAVSAAIVDLIKADALKPRLAPAKTA